MRVELDESVLKSFGYQSVSMARLMGLWNCSSRATLSAAACVGRVVMVGPNYTRLMSMSRVSVLRQRALLLGTRQAPLSGVRALSTVARRKVPFTKHNNKVEQVRLSMFVD